MRTTTTVTTTKAYEVVVNYGMFFQNKKGFETLKEAREYFNSMKEYPMLNEMYLVEYIITETTTKKLFSKKVSRVAKTNDLDYFER